VNYLSLFSGIGGLDLGLDRAGMTCVGQVELDPWCRTVLDRHWPEVPKHDDVRTAPAWWMGRGNPPVDLVAGGFPCQPFSVAGRQRGTADERWGWPWFCDVLRVVRPRYVLVENVAALLRDADAFGCVLGDLHRLGFDAQWSVVSACTAGAPHPRKRVFLVAHPRREGLQGIHQPRGAVDLQPVAEASRGRWEAEPDLARVADGVPRRLVLDAVKGLGNAVVPAVGEMIGRLIMDDAEHHKDNPIGW
jgi:DNA (cytosine-5)-methyltransferase 1